MKRILFVDDEPHVLEGLKRMLYPLRGEWQTAFVSSGQEALQLLDTSPFDVLVTDLRMPGMSGIELLTAVVKSHPQVVRMVLSGTADQDMTLRSVLLAHQFLVKPCDARTLRERVQRALSLRYLLTDEALRQLVSGIHTLPSLPDAYTKLVETLNSKEASAAEVGRIIAGDMAMTAKVLQLVNSCFFGARRPITDPGEAVVYLGIEPVASLTLSVSVFSQFEASRFRRFSLAALRSHSVEVATLARKIAVSMNFERDAVQCVFTAGLLHDVGKLVLAANRPAEYDAALDTAIEKGIPAEEAEREAFGTTHAEIGAFLLWLWGLPEELIDAVGSHHRSTTPAPMSPIVPLQFADAIVNTQTDVGRDLSYLGPLAEQLPHWKSLYLEMSAGGPHAQAHTLR